MPKLVEYKISTVNRWQGKTEVEGTISLCSEEKVLNDSTNLEEININRIKIRELIFVSEGTLTDEQINRKLKEYCKEKFPHLKIIN